MWLKFQQLLTELQTAVTWVLDEQYGIQKKQKSSEFDAEDDGHIKMGPAVKVWSHEGFILTSKIAKKCLMRLKNGCSTGLQNLFERQEKGFL